MSSSRRKKLRAAAKRGNSAKRSGNEPREVGATAFASDLANALNAQLAAVDAGRSSGPLDLAGDPAVLLVRFLEMSQMPLSGEPTVHDANIGLNRQEAFIRFARAALADPAWRSELRTIVLWTRRINSMLSGVHANEHAHGKADRRLLAVHRFIEYVHSRLLEAFEIVFPKAESLRSSLCEGLEPIIVREAVRYVGDVLPQEAGRLGAALATVTTAYRALCNGDRARAVFELQNVLAEQPVADTQRNRRSAVQTYERWLRRPMRAALQAPP